MSLNEESLLAVKILSEELADFKKEHEDTINKEKEFRAKEDFAAKTYFAEEIFLLRQRKLTLDTEIMLREKRIRRIELGYE